MTFVRSFILNFLMVFFVDRVAPGVEITYFEQVPDVGADLIFSVLLGFINAAVFPVLMCTEWEITKVKIALITCLISFGAFGLIAAFPFGVQVLNAAGFFLGGGIVWAVAFFSNYLEWKHAKPTS